MGCAFVQKWNLNSFLLQLENGSKNHRIVNENGLN